MIRLVVVSDTHCYHEQIALPDGDILVHAGDFSSSGSERQVRAFAAHFRAQPHPHKVIIAGNHDRAIEKDAALADELFGEWYLFESSVSLCGLTFWGAPWQPWFLDWSFNLPRGAALREKWALIPSGIDVLMTHGPPKGILDTTFSGDSAGCEELLAALDRVAPRVHLFGHIHEGYGWLQRGPTLHVNASCCTVAYEPVNRPIVIDIPLEGLATVVL